MFVTVFWAIFLVIWGEGIFCFYKVRCAHHTCFCPEPIAVRKLQVQDNAATFTLLSKKEDLLHCSLLRFWPENFIGIKLHLADVSIYGKSWPTWFSSLVLFGILGFCIGFYYLEQFLDCFQFYYSNWMWSTTKERHRQLLPAGPNIML